jgi:hypothetical protein
MHEPKRQRNVLLSDIVSALTRVCLRAPGNSFLDNEHARCYQTAESITKARIEAIHTQKSSTL